MSESDTSSQQSADSLPSDADDDELFFDLTDEFFEELFELLCTKASSSNSLLLNSY